MSSVTAVGARFSREKLLQAARSLPADLQVLAQLGEMLQDINCELDDIAGLLRRDVALATRIVRISNSPMFGGSGRIASVDEAVNRVGFSEILKLVGTAATGRLTEHALESYDISAADLRNNMLYGAFATEALARPAGIDPRMAYTAGLMRPLGLMVLDRMARGQIGGVQRYSSSGWPSYSAWEGSMFGVDNCEVTALILEEWGFPAELSRALRVHYLARLSDGENALAALLNVANALAARVSRSFPGEAAWWLTSPKKLNQAGLTEDDFGPALAAADKAMVAAAAALRAS